MSNHVCSLSNLWCSDDSVQNVEQENDEDGSDENSSNGTLGGNHLIALAFAAACPWALVSPVHSTTHGYSLIASTDAALLSFR
jgi:hypothetical protein